MKILALAFLFFVSAHAAFLGQSVPVTITTADTSKSISLALQGSTQIAITVKGASKGVYVTIRDTCTAGRGAATKINQNILIPQGMTVLARPVPGTCLAVTSGDSTIVDTVSVVLGVNK